MTRTFAALLFALTLSAEELPLLVRDLPGVSTVSSMSEGRFWTTVGNTTYFTARSTPTMLDVYRTDGTAAGTVRMTAGTGTPENRPDSPFLGVVNGKLVYVGERDAGGGVYALDTHGGAPIRITGADAGANGAVVNGVLHFSAAAPGRGRELWRTDGTPAGTYEIDLMPGEAGAFDGTRDESVHALGDSIYFFGRTPQGTGLVRTSGTPATTTLVFPLTESDLYNDTGTVQTLGNRLLFHLDGGDGRPGALWGTDGTTAGTVALAEVQHDPGRFAVFGGKLLFEGPEGTIWSTDGTREGTRATDIVPPSRSATTYSGQVVGNKLFFYRREFAGGTWTTRLFVTEGTAATTRAVMEVEHSGGYSNGEGFVIGDKYYFRHDDGVHGMELWVTDGTTPQLFADIYPGLPRSIEVAGGEARPDGTLLFVALHPAVGEEPWITDGTRAGTRLLANVAPDTAIHSSSPRGLRASGKRVFFIADLTGGEGVGVSDGTSAGTTASAIGSGLGIGAQVAAANGRYFFGMDGGLHASDGTAGGTTSLGRPATTPYAVRGGVVFLDPADDSLWFSDGTLGGTRKLRDLDDAHSVHPAGDVAWLADGSALWITDGTDAGTRAITPADPYTGPLLDATGVGTTTYFFEWSSSASRGEKLWRSDGTSAGTRIVKAFDPQLGGAEFVGASGGLVYFFIGRQLHRSDGTAAGTVALPAYSTTFCQSATPFGRDLLLLTVGTDSLPTVWRTDGTAAGTTKLASLRRPPQGTDCAPIVARGERAYFAGWTSAQGWEPWVTDGTAAGTRMLVDLYPGRTGSNPRELTLAEDRVFFSADTPNIGRELWAIGARAAVPRSRAVRP